jgi:ABC-2 type transport system ATP-binding protein
LPPSAGSVKVAGFDVMHQSLEVRKRIGYLPENVPLYPDMTVRSYLEFMGGLKGVRGKLLKARLDEVMPRCRVDDVADKIVGKLSKGYRQRVGLAQALIGDPEVLILDEPTVGLDPRQIIDTRQLIRDLSGSHTVILSTHILPEVSVTCSRVLIIDRGQIVAEDTPENLDRRLSGGERVELEVRGPVAAVQQSLRAVSSVTRIAVEENHSTARFTVDYSQGSDPRPQLAAAVVNGGWELLQMRSVGMSLEEIYLKLITREEVPA